VKSKQAYLRK